MSQRIPDASAELILAAAEAVYYLRPDFDIQKIATYIGTTSEATARGALEGAKLLGFLIEAPNGTYLPEGRILHLQTHADGLARRMLFRVRLEEFRSFQVFKERVLCGDSALESAKKVKLLQDIETEVTKVKDIFQQWGLYGQSFSQDQIGNLVCSSEEGLTPAYLLKVRASIASAEQARVFMQARIGEDYFRQLPAEVVDSFSSAMVRCHARHEPKPEIMFAIGTSMEKFLSFIAAKASPAVDLLGTNGMVQMAERLRSRDVLTRKHFGLIQAVGAVRNAADHGVDTDIDKVWTLTYEAILDAGLIALDAVRSIMSWTETETAVI
jgi:hypothetical protein